ncbi:MAG: VCBS repeat-containing protein [Vitreoscilla sp.]|nr:VCBS repeat-containing protein [Vitreoscilla sp.]
MKRVACLAGLMLLGATVPGAQPPYTMTLIEVSKVWGSAVADYDRDGHEDLLIEGHDANDRIWYWTPGGYRPSAQVLTHSDRHGCDVADINADGLPDIYCAIGGEGGFGIGLNEMWVQQPSGQHVDRAQEMGIQDPYGRGRIPVFFDMNHDGYPDIYLTNLSTTRPDGHPNINRVFVNQGGLSFSELTTLATGAKGSKCVAKGDINVDGWDDLLVCVNKAPGHLYVNNQAGDFQELMPRPAETEWKDAKLADLNDDGRDDLLLITATNTFQVWLNSGGGRFFDTLSYQQKLPAWGESIAVGDFNRDGRRDVYVVQRDPNCETTGRDLAGDLIFFGRAGGGWVKALLPQALDGCGYLADVVDGSKILVMNGGGGWRGPSYLIEAK